MRTPTFTGANPLAILGKMGTRGGKESIDDAHSVQAPGWTTSPGPNATKSCIVGDTRNESRFGKVAVTSTRNCPSSAYLNSVPLLGAWDAGSSWPAIWPVGQITALTFPGLWQGQSFYRRIGAANTR